MFHGQTVKKGCSGRSCNIMSRKTTPLWCGLCGRPDGAMQGTLMPEKAVEAFFGSFYLSSRKYERPRWAGGWFSRLFLSETIISTAMVTR